MYSNATIHRRNFVLEQVLRQSTKLASNKRRASIIIVVCRKKSKRKRNLFHAFTVNPWCGTVFLFRTIYRTINREGVFLIERLRVRSHANNTWPSELKILVREPTETCQWTRETSHRVKCNDPRALTRVPARENKRLFKETHKRGLTVGECDRRENQEARDSGTCLVGHCWSGSLYQVRELNAPLVFREQRGERPRSRKFLHRSDRARWNTTLKEASVAHGGHVGNCGGVCATPVTVLETSKPVENQ